MKENNPRKGKVVYNLWLKPEEEKQLNKLAGEGFFEDELDRVLIMGLMREIKSRGDLEKR